MSRGWNPPGGSARLRIGTTSPGSRVEWLPAQGGPMANILVVDDDLDIVELVKSMLVAKHNVVGATDSNTALDIIKNSDINLLITDVRMPNVNGFILINQAKKLKPNLNVIIISAYYDENDEIARQVVKRYAD